MTTQIKFFLVVLILAASFVVFRIFFLFSNRLDTAVAVNDPVKVEYDESNDYDHDGLSNTDEAYWNTDPFKADTDGDGFLDGEEVLSKHDPMDSGPEDSFEEKSKIFTSNLTESLLEAFQQLGLERLLYKLHAKLFRKVSHTEQPVDLLSPYHFQQKKLYFQ